MRQLTLDIRPEAPPGFDDFVPGANGELLARLRALSGSRAGEALYMWGAPGSGRSHLLQAATSAARAAGRVAEYVRGASAGDDLLAAPGGLLAVDDVELLPNGAQIALFRAFNALREGGPTLLVSAAAPPLRLSLREDLRTRLGSALVFEVKPLTDEDKARTLAGHARARGMRLEPGIIQYLLRHGRRDLRWLLAVLDALDAASLEQQRPITLPLLRQVLPGANRE
jgi:DnaA family protein